MSETVRTVIESALELPENDRAKLARAVLLSLEDGIDDNVEEAWDAEIARRVAKVNDGTAVGRPAEDVLDEIRARFQRNRSS